MTLKDTLRLLLPSDRLRIIRGKEILYAGYPGNLKRERNGQLTGEEEVEQLRAVPEIRHRQWKEKGLIPPFEPELTAQYTFSDMEFKLYYDIYLK